jgi:hypothetical protein
MIRGVTLKRFKRFDTLDVELPGHVVLAGPNNGGKTTVLQAIAAWSLALKHWRERNSTARPHGTYPFAYIARPDFLAVPLPQNGMDLLWRNRRTGDPVVIGLRSSEGWTISMEFEFDEEQVRVRPTGPSDPDAIWEASLKTIYVPPMTGMAPQEPYYGDDALLDARLAEGRPGEVLRNLLSRASNVESAWAQILEPIQRMFGYMLLPPARGRYLTATYRQSSGGPEFDLGSAGSGFQQVVMLLTFLALKPGSVLLVDEPDAHLHVILQDAIFHELQKIAARQASQLILSTHSEVIIDSVAAEEIVLMPRGRPLRDQAGTPLSGPSDRQALVRGLRILSNTDLMLAESTPGILYLEGPTDLAILRAFAERLGHPAFNLLTTSVFWHRYSDQTREGAAGFSSRDHFEALRLHQAGLKGLEILDRDGNPNLPEIAVNGQGLQRIRWQRYEIESYLVHPAALARFVERRVGGGDQSAQHRADLAQHFEQEYPPAFLRDPHVDLPLLNATKARSDLIPRALAAAGLPGIEYTEYFEIATLMEPNEIHLEVRQKLDAICAAFGLPIIGATSAAGVHP